MDFHAIVQQVIDFVRSNESWALPIVFALAFGESLAFISLLIPATVALVGIGALIGASGIDFVPIWIAASLGAAVGDWLSFWFGVTFKEAVAKFWPLSHYPDLIPRGEGFVQRFGIYAVAIGRLLAPANTVTRPSVSIRTDNSAPTRLRLYARTLPVSRPVPEMPTSAFGAVATTVPSASRTTMSRKRNDVRPFSSRSIWVPPTDTVCLPPKFFSIAAFNHGVATSSSIGPLVRRHHRPAIPTATTANVRVATQKMRCANRQCKSRIAPRRRAFQCRPAEPSAA